MPAAVALQNYELARAILSYVINFWEAPALSQACRGAAATAQGHIRDFYASYQQYEWHLCCLYADEEETRLLRLDLQRDYEAELGYETD